MSFALYFEVPGKDPQVVSLSQDVLKVGSLLSNQIVISSSEIEPIHFLLEQESEMQWLLTDLSDSGLSVNGVRVDVDVKLKRGDTIQVANLKLKFDEYQTLLKLMPKSTSSMPPTPPPPVSLSDKETSQTDTSKVSVKDKKIEIKDGQPYKERRLLSTLFTPRTAQAKGDVLEVVAYWQSQILEIEHFHPSFTGYKSVGIGDPTKTHFPSAGEEELIDYQLAEAKEDGYIIHLKEGMTARLRKSGKVESVGQGEYKMGRRDIAHVRYGPIHYFLIFMRNMVFYL